MFEFYPVIRAVHIAAISLSGAWLIIRGLALLGGMRWPFALPIRLLGWTIDGTVLTAATMLLTMLPAELFANHWLTVKLAFVGIYFIAGWKALSPGVTRRSRRLVLLAVAASAFGIAYGIALAHEPMGWFASR